MKHMQTSLTDVTMGFAALAALGVVGANWILAPLLPPAMLFKLSVWSVVAGYALVLRNMSSHRAPALFFPLGMLLAAAGGTCSATTFLLLALLILSWIRSGLLLPQRRAAGVLAEALFCGGGAGIVYLMAPTSLLGAGLGVWLFFLVQAFYGLVVPVEYMPEGSTCDPFDSARHKAETILEAWDQ